MMLAAQGGAKALVLHDNRRTGGSSGQKKIVSSPLLKETPDMCELYSGLNDKSDPCARSNLKNYGMCRKCRISLAKLGRIVLPWTRGFLKAGTTS